jgi:hypothetical protein
MAAGTTGQPGHPELPQGEEQTNPLLSLRVATVLAADPS